MSSLQPSPLPCYRPLSNTFALSFSLPFLFQWCLPLLSPPSTPRSPCLTYLGFIPPPFSLWARFCRRSLEFSLCVHFLLETPARRKKLLFILLCIPMRSKRLNAERTERKEGMSDGRFCFAAFCTISHGFSLDLLRFCWIKNNASGSGTVGKKWRGRKAFRHEFLLDSQLAISHIRLTEASFCVTNSHSNHLHSGTDSY